MIPLSCLFVNNEAGAKRISIKMKYWNKWHGSVYLNTLNAAKLINTIQDIVAVFEWSMSRKLQVNRSNVQADISADIPAGVRR